MSSVLPFLIPVAMLATFGVLAAGLVVMFRGGAVNKKYGNKLMQMRVLFQAGAVALIVLFMLLAGRG